MGSVVNIRRKQADVYIGRSRNNARGPWGNPFHIGRDGTRDEVIAKYREHLWSRINDEPGFIEELAGLADKKLGCFCAPEPCHGDVLARAARWAARELGR